MTIGKLGEYKILKELGRGGMGVVHLAEHQRLLTKYALKVLPQAFSEDPQLVERFHNEARVMAELTHPNIVKVVNMSCEGTTYYLVMEYVESETGAPKNLHQLMREHGGKIPEDITESIVLNILSALETAHERGIIHRDIKPANILLDKDGTAKVADFGLVKILGGEDRTATKKVTLTVEGLVLGTYDFMSPEQKAGKPVDFRTDIYAIGVIIYSMLTGRKPEGRFSLPSEINPELPKKWDIIVDKCLQNLPEDRYQSASDVIKAIKTKKEVRVKKAKKVPKERKAHRGFLRDLLRYGTVIIVVLIVVSAIMSYVMFKDKDFREMLKSTISSALSEVQKKPKSDATGTQAPLKKETPPSEEARNQLVIKKPDKGSKVQILTAPPKPPQAEPGLDILGGTEFIDAIQKLASVLDKEGLTAENKELSEYYKQATPQEKVLLDSLLKLGSGFLKYYSESPVDSEKDFTQSLQEYKKFIPPEGPMKKSWDAVTKKFEEGKQYREKGDTEKSRQSFAEAQREMRKLTLFQITKQQADMAKASMEKVKIRTDETRPGTKKDLLYGTASKTEGDANLAYKENDYQRAKILYTISGKIFGRSTKDYEPLECVEILRKLVGNSKGEADRMDASTEEESLYVLAGRKEQQALSAFENEDFKNAAAAYVEAAYFYERAKERIIRSRALQTRADRKSP
jgi:serine/threonine protein kinase